MSITEQLVHNLDLDSSYIEELAVLSEDENYEIDEDSFDDLE